MVKNTSTNTERKKIVKSTSAEEIDDLRVRFLKDALTYLEARIKLIDNKASIFIAIQAGLFALITYTTTELFWTEELSIIKSVTYAFLAADFVIMSLTILLLVQTIRPSRGLLSLEIPLDQMEMEDYVMWPQKGGFPKSAKDYRTRIESLDLSRIRANYERAHYITLQLIRIKYRYYRWAAFGMKCMVLWSAIGVVAFSLLKLY